MPTFLQSATITLTNRPDGISESLLTDVTDTEIVATYDPTTGILTLSGTDSVTNYEKVFRTLQYSNSETTPDTADRIIEMTIISDRAINNTSVVAISTITFDTPSNNTITGTPLMTTLSSVPPGDDTLTGLGGNDTLIGLGGNDTINGNAGNDIIIGNAGNDTLIGNAGNDTINGGEGDDLISGGNGSDFLFGDAGEDLISGGRGNDFLFGDAGDDRIIGGRGNDFLFGDAGNDRISGGDGRDTIEGGEGNDRIIGQAGDDTLIGVGSNAATPGNGEKDTLIGGEGADLFVLGDASNVFYSGSGNADFARVQDFNAAEGDRIQLSGSMSDYSLQLSRGNTRIFASDGSTADLVGIVLGVSLTDLSSGFDFT